MQKKLFKLFLLLQLCLFSDYVFSQQDSIKKFEKRYEVLKDSIALLRPLIPAVSSVIVSNHQVEINFFNSLSSANKYRDDNSHLQEINARQTYFYSTVQFTYGLSKKNNFNVGVDINSALGRIDLNPNSSIFKVFNSNTQGFNGYASAITSITPRIRWRPLRKNYNFIVQGGFIIPTNISEKKQSILGWEQVYFFSQFLYNFQLDKKLFLFAQLNPQYGFKSNNAVSTFYLPAAAYLSFLASKRIIIFTLTDYIPVFVKNGYRYDFQLGGGVQYQISRHFLVNGYYTSDIVGKNYGDFNSYNVSLRYTSK